jgi:hypothetical protein
MKMIKKDQIVQGEIQRSPRRLASFTLLILLSLLALACGIAITIYLLNTSPKVSSVKPAQGTILVEGQVNRAPQ